MAVIKWRTETDDGEPVEHRIPAAWEICDMCAGDGKHSRAVEADGGGLTASELAEWDHEEVETYFAGGYDRTCEDCHGSGKVLVTDWAALEAADPVLCSRYERHLRGVADDDREIAAERRMGC